MATANDKKQLLIKSGQDYKDIFPINYIINVIDFDSKENLESILKRFNHVMVQVTGTKSVIRANVPVLLRHKGLHISFMFNDKLYTEYYKGTNYADTEWIKDSNWGFTLNDNNNNQIIIDKGTITLDMLSKEVQEVLSSIVDISKLMAVASATQGDTASANVTYANGKFTFSFVLPRGAQGLQGTKGDKGDKGDKGEQGERGLQGPTGPKGDSFSISKTYVSIAAMNAGFASDGVPNGGFVMIDTGNVNDADNAKLYVKGVSSYTYITDLSGATGIQGPTGPQGIQGPKGDKGDRGEQGPAGGAASVAMRVYNGYIQYSTDGGSNYTNLIAVADLKGDKGDTGLKGDKGDKGDRGEQGPQGPAGTSGATLTKAQIIAKLNEAGEVTMTQHWVMSAGIANTGTV